MPRYLVPSSTLPAVNPHDERMASLARLNTSHPPVATCSATWSYSGFYAGPTSIAYLYYRLACLFPAESFKSQSYLDWAAAYLQLGAARQRQQQQQQQQQRAQDYEQYAGVDPDHCGVANETLCQIALSAVLHDDEGLARKLCEVQGTINLSDGGSDEWLYGRAGYLYLLRLVGSGFGAETHPETHALIMRAKAKTVQRILESPRPWTWHGKPYIGAVHGAIGIMAQVLLSCDGDDQASEVASELRRDIQCVLDMQFSSGNFPSNFGKQDTDKLVQFCHGAPGVILCLRRIMPFYSPDDSGAFARKLKMAIVVGQRCIRERGLLTKNPCLCHGIPTNAFALDEDERMEKFGRYMGSESLERVDWVGTDEENGGLWTGEAGRAWFWAAMEKGTRDLIGFDDL